MACSSPQTQSLLCGATVPLCGTPSDMCIVVWTTYRPRGWYVTYPGDIRAFLLQFSSLLSPGVAFFVKEKGGIVRQVRQDMLETNTWYPVTLLNVGYLPRTCICLDSYFRISISLQEICKTKSQMCICHMLWGFNIRVRNPGIYIVKNGMCFPLLCWDS